LIIFLFIFQFADKLYNIVFGVNLARFLKLHEIIITNYIL